jgi:hypothetical protein
MSKFTRRLYSFDTYRRLENFYSKTFLQFGAVGALSGLGYYGYHIDNHREVDIKIIEGTISCATGFLFGALYPVSLPSFGFYQMGRYHRKLNDELDDID